MQSIKELTSAIEEEYQIIGAKSHELTSLFQLENPDRNRSNPKLYLEQE